MSLLYFKRRWDETTGDPLTDDWGSSTFYFETDGTGEVIRQVIVYQNGKVLKYDEDNFEDDYGGLTDQPLDLQEFNEFKITPDEFDMSWALL
jgi:hypothetical protein